MSRLAKACSQFIDHEQRIQKATANDENLLETYGSYVDGLETPTTTQAEHAFNAFQAIERNRKAIEESRSIMNEAAEVIKEHLDVLHGKPFTYVYPSGIMHLTYTFSLNKEGEVVHNQPVAH